jgi:hypothetical protein
MHNGCWWGDLRERDQLEDLGVDDRTTVYYLNRSSRSGGGGYGLDRTVDGLL